MLLTKGEISLTQNALDNSFFTYNSSILLYFSRNEIKSESNTLQKKSYINK